MDSEDDNDKRGTHTANNSMIQEKLQQLDEMMQRPLSHPNTSSKQESNDMTHGLMSSAKKVDFLIQDQQVTSFNNDNFEEINEPDDYYEHEIDQQNEFQDYQQSQQQYVSAKQIVAAASGYLSRQSEQTVKSSKIRSRKMSEAVSDEKIMEDVKMREVNKVLRPFVLTMVGPGIQKHFNEKDIFKMLMKNLMIRQKTGTVPAESIHKAKGHCFAFLNFKDAKQMKSFVETFPIAHTKQGKFFIKQCQDKSVVQGQEFKRLYQLYY